MDVISTLARSRTSPTHDPNTPGKQLMSWTGRDTVDKGNPPLVSDSLCFLIVRSGSRRFYVTGRTAVVL